MPHSRECSLCKDLLLKNNHSCIHETLGNYEESMARGCTSCGILYQTAIHAILKLKLKQISKQALIVFFQRCLFSENLVMSLQFKKESWQPELKRIEKLTKPTKTHWIEMNIFTAKGDPFPSTIKRSISVRSFLTGHTGDDARLQLAQTWLAECDEFHTCASSAILPTRILDIAGSSIRVVEGRGRMEKYAALSHCWGAGSPLKLTTSTLQEYTKGVGVLWGDISPLFRDAIDFSRRLGLRFLWIDSLCIIQDALEDWKVEGEKMAQVYNNAYVTLAATASKDNHSTMFTPATPVFTVNASTDDGQPYRLRIRQDVNQVQESNPSLFPLLKRGWVFQERLLSPRVIHFGPGEIFWECFECSRYEFDPRVYSPKLKMRWESTNCEIWWRELIKQYTELELTYPNDRLMALAGVMDKMRTIRRDEYIGGIWKKTLLDDLLWTVVEPEPATARLEIAPSWSWASRNVAVSYKALDYFKDVSREFRSYEASVLNINMDVNEPHQIRGSLTLKTKIKPLVPHKNIKEHHDFGEHFYFDCANDLDAWENRELFIVHMQSRSNEEFNLIVKAATDRSGKYQRVGAMKVTYRVQNKLTLFFDYEGADEVVITLV